MKSGSLALFAIPLKEDIAEGTRRYLFTTRSRQVMFGISGDSEALPYQLFAELKRLQERQHLNHQVMEETLGELASLLQSPKFTAAEIGACRRVG